MVIFMPYRVWHAMPESNTAYLGVCNEKAGSLGAGRKFACKQAPTYRYSAGEDFGEFCRVLAAAHGEVGLAAAFAAQLGAEIADDLAGLLAGLDRGG